MASITIQVSGYRCDRCSHQWTPRRTDASKPRICPKCKSQYWDQPRQQS